MRIVKQDKATQEKVPARSQRLPPECIGLKTLYDGPSKPDWTSKKSEAVDIVAVHGIGAHPDQTWTTKSYEDSTRYVNWLFDDGMLPEVLPNVRIMRYGYESDWFGPSSIATTTDIIAERLLEDLTDDREAHGLTQRPIIFLGHCFGGLVILRTLVDAKRQETRWSGLFKCVTGLMFFGTPFRGASGLSQAELLEVVRSKYTQGHAGGILSENLTILKPGNEALASLMNQFMETRQEPALAEIVCFYELKPSNVGAIVKGEPMIEFVVNISSGSLDKGEHTNAFSMVKDHFDLVKFSSPQERDFKKVCKELKKLVLSAPDIQARLHKLGSQHRVPFSMHGLASTKRFVGRSNELDALQSLLQPRSTIHRGRKVVVVQAPAGMGKTQFVLQFCRLHKDFYSAVLWVNGKDRDSLLRELAALSNRIPSDELDHHARRFAETGLGDLEGVAADVRKWLDLSTNKSWLLVIDGFDETSMIEALELLPRSDHGSIIYCSQDHDLIDVAENIQLKPLSTSEAEQLAACHLMQRGSESTALAALVKGHPLDLIQAACYLRDANISMNEFEEQYNALDFNNDARPHDYKPSAGLHSRASHLNIEQLQRSHGEADRLARLLAFFDCDQLSHHLICKTTQRFWLPSRPRWVEDLGNNKTQYDALILILVGASLLSASEEPGKHIMHSIVRKIYTRGSTEQQQIDMIMLSASLVAAAVPSPSQPSVDKLRQSLLAQVQVSISHMANLKIITSQDLMETATITIYLRFALLFEGMSMYRQAASAYNQCMAACKSIYDPEHDRYLSTACDVARFYTSFSHAAPENYGIALELHQAVIQGCEKSHGPDHKCLNDSLLHLGLLYHDKGEYKEAKACLLKYLKFDLDSPQFESLDFDTRNDFDPDAISNLAGVYSSEGNYCLAERLYKYSLRQFEGPGPHKDEPATYDLLNNLGLVYSHLEKYDEAERCHLKSVEGKCRIWGADHLRTLNSQHNLAIVYAAQKRNQLAEELLLDTLHRHADHHENAVESVLHTLGSLYIDLDRFQDAESMLLKSFSLKKRVHGPNSRGALLTATNICDLYVRQKRFAQCEEWIERTRKGFLKLHGRPSIDSANMHTVRAVLKGKQGLLDEKLQCYEAALEEYLEAVGEHHAGTLKTLHNLAIDHEGRKSFDLAYPYARRAVEGLRVILPEDNKLLLNALWTLSLVQWGRKEYKASLESMIRVERGFSQLKHLTGNEVASARKNVRELEALCATEEMERLAITDGSVAPSSDPAAEEA